MENKDDDDDDDETDIDMLWNGSKENGNVRSECEGDDSIDCEDGDGDTLW